jgi:hypothetical protein
MTRSGRLAEASLGQQYSSRLREYFDHFRYYIKQLVKIGISASLALGVVVAILLLIVGETTAEIDLTLEFEALDGIWFLIGLPIIMTLALLLLSPLSYGLYRLIYRLPSDQPRDGA